MGSELRVKTGESDVLLTVHLNIIFAINQLNAQILRPLGRPRRRWVDNIRWISRKWDVGIWTGLGWPRIEIVGGWL